MGQIEDESLRGRWVLWSSVRAQIHKHNQHSSSSQDNNEGIWFMLCRTSCLSREVSEMAKNPSHQVQSFMFSYKSLNSLQIVAGMQTVNVSFFRLTWIMIYFSTRSPAHRVINPAWQSLIPATVYTVHESSPRFCFRASSKELLMNTQHFFTPQNYHITIIHLHDIFKYRRFREIRRWYKCVQHHYKYKKMLHPVWITGNISLLLFLLPNIHHKNSWTEKEWCKIREFWDQACAVLSINSFTVHLRIGSFLT